VTAAHPDPVQLVLLTLLWALYLALHSVLASLRCKALVAQRWPRWFAWYRLVFNVIALAALLPPLWLMQKLHGPLLLEWSGAWAWLADGLAVSAVMGTVWTARYYDMPAFIGLRSAPASNRARSSDALFVLSPLHHLVRHPWYFLALIILWTRNLDAAHLVTALVANLYFVLGSRLEERKLAIEFGAAYRDYQRLVPGLIPRPWRILRRADAQRFMSASRPDAH
jgi:protein-S-isoprenylcysteine O-methyltransferase Ste14